MKRTLLATFIVLVPLALSSCGPRGGWKDFNTPARFLKMAEKYPRDCTLSTSGDFKSSSDPDYNLEVKKALLEAGPFTKTEQTSSDADRVFTYANRYYDGHIGLAAARYCLMSVYDDGFIKITYQDTKEDKYAYFTMDEAKASEINDFVIAKIARDREAVMEDKTKAYQEATVDNFLAEMDKKSSVKAVAYYTDSNDNYFVKNFDDKGTLLKMMKEVEYTKTSDPAPDSEYALVYNSATKGDNYFEWTYCLYNTGDYVRVYYGNTNRFDYSQTIYLSYKIDATKGKEIINKAIALSK